MADLTPIELNDYPLWEIQAGEEDKPFERFQKYYLPFPRRSVRGAYSRYLESQIPPESPTKDGNRKEWGVWAKQYRWEERAIAYHRYLAHENLEFFAEKQRELIEKEANLSLKLFNKASQILDLPIDEETSVKDAATLIRAASEIGRKALDMTPIRSALAMIEREGWTVSNPAILEFMKQEARNLMNEQEI